METKNVVKKPKPQKKKKNYFSIAKKSENVKFAASPSTKGSLNITIKEGLWTVSRRLDATQVKKLKRYLNRWLRENKD